MDNMQILYIVGAFVLGFLIAWFAGRRGPQSALEECEANASSVQRKLDDRSRTLSKLEAQSKEQQAQVGKMTTDNTNLMEMLKTSEKGLSDAGAEIARLQAQLDETSSDRLLMQTELGHVRGAWSQARAKVAELNIQLDEAIAVAQARAQAEAKAAEEVTALAPVPGPSDEVKALTRRVNSLQSELELARAATARMAALSALRPRLTSDKREEYAALAGDPERVVAALHERDMAIADTANEASYLRRNLSTLSAVGAELATTLNKRNREHELLLGRLSALTATEPSTFVSYAAITSMRELPVMPPAGFIEQRQPSETQAVSAGTPEEVAIGEAGQPSEGDVVSAVATELRDQMAEIEVLRGELEKQQANLDEMDADLEALGATKTDLDAQLETRDSELADLKNRLAALQTEAESAAAAKSDLETKLQARSAELTALLSRLAVLDLDLQTIAGDEDAAQVAAVAAAPVEAMQDETAPVAATPSATTAAEGTPSEPAAEAAPVAGAEGETADVQGEIRPMVERSPEAAEVAQQPPVVRSLAAGVAIAVAAFKRKNARLAASLLQIDAVNSEKSSLESSLADKSQALEATQSQLATLQDGFRERSYRFDALSLRASSLEADIEIARLDRTKFEEHIKQIAGQLSGVAAEFAESNGNGAAHLALESPAGAPEETAAPVETAAPEAVRAADMIPGEQPAPDQAIPPAAAEMPAEADVTEVPATEPVQSPVSTLEMLSAGAAAITALVRQKAGALTDANTRVISLQDEMATLMVDKSGLQAGLEAKDTSLADLQSQLALLQTDVAGRGSEIDGLNQKLAGVQAELESANAAKDALENDLQTLGAQLNDLLVEFDQEAPAPEASASETAAPETAAPETAAPETAAPETAAPETAAAAEPEVKVGNGPATAAAAIATLLKRKQDLLEEANSRIATLEDEISALTSQNTDLETNLAERQKALADREAQVMALQTVLDNTQAAKSDLEDELTQLDNQFRSLLAEFGQNGEDEAMAPPTDEGVSGTETSQQTVPAVLAGAAGVAALLKRKSDALGEVRLQAESQQAELAGRATDLEALNQQIAVLQGELDSTQAAKASLEEEKANLEGELSQLNVQLDELSAQFGQDGEAGAEGATEAEGIASEGEAPGAVVAGAAGVAALLKRKSDALAEARTQAESLQAELATLQSELDSTQAAKASLEEELSQLNAQLDELSAQFGQDGEAAVEDATETEGVAPGAVVAGAAGMAALLKRKSDALAEARIQAESQQAELAGRTADLEALNQQIAALQGELDSTQTAKASLEEELSQLNAQLDELSAQFGQEGEAAAEAESEAEGVAPGAVVAGAAGMAALLKRKSDALVEARTQAESLQTELSGRNAELETLNQQIVSLQTELDETRAARTQLETDLQKRDEEIEHLDQKTADLQSRLNAAESERLRLAAEMESLGEDLAELGAAVDADDEGLLQQFSQKVSPAPAEPAATGIVAPGEEVGGPTVAKIVGVTAVLDAIQKKRAALKDANAQLAAMQEELSGLSASKDELEAQFSQQTAAQESAQVSQASELATQLDALKLQLDNALADRDSIRALLDERNGEFMAATATLTALQSPPVKRMSDFKARAVAAAAERGVEASTTSTLQDLVEVKHIGVTFEQRLYRVGVGTYWELANLTADDLDLTLKLSDMQKLAISFDEVRDDARRLAEETNSVGAIWEGDVPDDFEPIPGIGKVFEQRLYNAGIRTYRDLANASPDQLASICKARKPLEPDYAGWIRQARKLMEVRNG